MEDKIKTTSYNPDIPYKRTRVFEHWYIVALFLIIYDLLVGAGSYFIALWLRFDCHFTEIPYAVSYTHLDVYKRQVLISECPKISESALISKPFSTQRVAKVWRSA